MNELQLNIESLEDRLLLSGNVFTQGANLIVEGTSAADTVEVRQIGGNLRVLVNNFDHGQFALPTGSINIDTFAGDDTITFQARIAVDAIVDSGFGNDVIHTGAGNDQITTGSGNDRVFGRAGDDVILGENGNDFLNGQDGNDVLDADIGENTLSGGAGDCLLYTSPSPRDLSTSRMPSSA